MIDRDQTICMSQGSLTWRYWIPNVRRTELSAQAGVINVNLELNSKLPCRIILEVDGLEAFVYNRTVSYDNIMETLSGQKKNQQDGVADKEIYDVFSKSASEDTIKPSELEATKPSSILGKILPINIKVNKGSIVAGNKGTQAILVLSYASADGVLDLQKADSQFDECRHSFQVNFERLQIALKPNISYEGDKEEIFYKSKPNSKKYANRWMLYRSLLNMWKLVHRKKSRADKNAEWRGLAQYLDTDSESVANVAAREHEYGKYTNILDADFVNYQYYYDMPGLVREDAPLTNPLDGLDVGNGGSAPRFGMNIQLFNATIFYGPWAERQRHSLHQMLFPTLCRDGVPQVKIKPGKHRIYTQYRLFVEIMDEAIIRVPIREFSKNEEFAESIKDTPDTKRPFGWIELKMDKGSTVSTKVGLVASNSGYGNRMNMSLQNLEVRSSVNHDIVLRCKEHVMDADIGYPLKWNGHSIWTFLNEAKNVETFFLREHVTLLSDMFTDFASGPATPYDLFRPFTYAIDLKVSKYAIYMNVNDANIINNPLDFNDNCYLSFQGDSLDINLHIPLEAVLRKVNTISFNLSTPQLSMLLDTPPWHTLNNFLENKEVGRSQDFRVDGSYTYHSEVGLDLVDTIIIGCKGKHMVLECYGFVVKYILSIKENYFGDFTRFKTLEEYTQLFNEENDQSTVEKKSVNSDATNKKKIFRRTENEKDVHFSFDVEEGCLVLPSNIYSCDSNMSLYFSALDIDLRFTNYYMDFEADITPVKGVYVGQCDPNSVLDIRGYETLVKHDLFVNGLAIHGHRMFGLPPDELKYFCKWDLSPGEVNFCGSAGALQGLLSSLIKLGFGYKNLENNLLFDEPEIHDVTSVSLVLPKVCLKLEDADIDSAVILELSKISFTFIDVPNPRYTAKVSAIVENILLNVQDKSTEKIQFEAQTSLKFSNFVQSRNFAGERAKQEEHLSQHDGPFHRAPFFLDESHRGSDYNGLYGSINPTFSLPDAAPPITSDTLDMIFEDIGLDTDPVLDDSLDSLSLETDATKMDFFQDFNSDFLPSSETKSSKNPRIKDYYRTVAGSSMSATGAYRDQDFLPEYRPDPNHEYDNLILNFGDIDITSSSSSIFVFLAFLEKFLTRSMTAVLDDLHIAVLKKLYMLRNKEAGTKNIRFVTPHVNFKFGDFSWEPESEPQKDIDYMGLEINNTSVVCSFVDTVQHTQEAVIALHVASIIFGIYQSGTSHENFGALRLTIEDLEFWSNKVQKTIESVTVRKLVLDADANRMKWLKLHVEQTANMVLKVVNEFSRIKKNVKASEIELLYQVTLASTIYRVEHDPAVITRPAYIIRLSRQHIRANDSWKVITRLRHIYEHLPIDWTKKQQDMFLAKQFKAPETAMSDVVGVFSSWRSWEFDDIDHSYIFRYVFSKKLEKPLIDTVFEYSVEEILVKLTDKTGEENFLAMDFLEVSGTKSYVEAMGASNNAGNDRSSSTSAKLSSIKGKISPLLQSFKVFTEINLSGDQSLNAHDSKKSPTVDQSQAKFSKKITQFVLVIEEYNIEMLCFKIGAAISGSEVAISALKNTEDGSQEFTSAFDSKNFVLNIISEGLPSVVYSVSNFGFNASSVDGLTTGANAVDVYASSAKLVLDQNSDHYAKMLRDLKTDVDEMSKILLFKKEAFERPASQKGAPESLLKALSATVRFNVKHLAWKISVLDPFSLVGAIENHSIDFSLHKTRATACVDISSFLSILKTHNRDVLKINSKNLNILSKIVIGFSDIMASNLVECFVKSGSTVILISDILNRVKQVRETVHEAQSSIHKLKESAEVFQTAKSVEDKRLAEGGISKSQVLKNISFDSNSFSIVIEVQKSTFGVDLSGIRGSYRDFELLDDVPSDVKPFGDFEVESTKLIVKDRMILPHLSTIFDMNFNLKVFNSRQDGLILQTLQVESTHCRLMLHPRTIVKLIEFASDMGHIVRSFSDLVPRSGSKSTPRASAEFSIPFHSIHMLFYNFCLGFMFDEPSEEFAGVITGSEKVFVISEGNIGKLSLIHAYVSVAKGKGSSDYFSSANEITSPNRAFLPNMQVMYAIKKVDNKKEINLRVTGEELDVKFVSSSIVLLEHTLKSVGTIDSLKKSIRKYPKAPVVTAASQESYKLPSDVTSITCLMNFAGGIVKLYRSDDFEVLEDIYSPSFELRTPAVKIAAEYSKTSGLKDHHVNFEVFTSSSSNKLFSTCVPVLFDIWRSMKSLGGSNGVAVQHAKKDDTNSIIKETDFVKVLTNFHVNLAIHVDRQELSLSCEPSAKVQAVVAIESIDIRLGTNDEDEAQPLSGVFRMGKVGASLQHSYSREVSGSVEVDQLLATLLLTGSEKVKVYAAGKIDNVFTYINLKQLQDLDLFKDLWFPDDVYEQSGSSKSSVKSLVSIREGLNDENLVVRFQKVSSSSAVPWNFDFLILNVSSEIDLGQSLGVLTLELDRFWAASRKKTNWEQNMSLGFDTISLKSKGRLSGHLSVKDIRLRSVIQWSLVGESLDIPLVLLSLGFQCIEAKASFDYNVFLVARVLNSYITVYNQIDKDKVLQDKLVASTMCQSIEIFTTALAASNILDIYNTISRIRQDNKRSYKEDLKTSTKGPDDQKKTLDIINVIATLRTELDVNFGKLVIQIYPGSLLDSQVLVIDVGGLIAHFEQKTVNDEIETDLHLNLRDTSVALSGFKKQLPEEMLTEMDVDKYIAHSANARGGGIFVFPSLESAMQTWQVPKHNVIKYKFKSEFGGKVDVRWNLGSVNFIGEMWATHARAFSSRLQKDPDFDKEKSTVPSLYNDVSIEEKLKDVELEGKYTYIAVETPVIGAPQLRDLGDATPPLEWFGLHRQRFPGITHQFVIIGLQQLVHEVEQQYGRVLGKA